MNRKVLIPNYEFKWKHENFPTYGQSLTTKLVVTLNYKLTQYLFIEGEF